MVFELTGLVWIQLTGLIWLGLDFGVGLKDWNKGLEFSGVKRLSFNVRQIATLAMHSNTHSGYRGCNRDLWFTGECIAVRGHICNHGANWFMGPP
uniref:Uncharacterized protein n=1 Tax=Anguilla anguilla TaxID=7936 RepID=A0A0E9TRH6_ANGAN